MPMLSVYVDDSTMERMRIASIQHGRTIDDLASCALAEAAIQAVPKMGDRYLEAQHRAIAAEL